MKPKHKHRRSSSTNIGQSKENKAENQSNNNKQCINLSDMTMGAVEVIKHINNSSMKIEQKQTIVQDINQKNLQVQVRERRRKNLSQIQEDLKNWDEFQVNFLNVKMHRNIKTGNKKDKSDKLYFPKSKKHKNQKQEQMLKPQLQNLSFERRRVLIVK